MTPLDGIDGDSRTCFPLFSRGQVLTVSRGQILWELTLNLMAFGCVVLCA